MNDMATTTRIQTAFRFTPELLTRVKHSARKENLSVNSYVERVLDKATALIFPKLPADFEIPEDLLQSAGCIPAPSIQEIKNDPRLAHALGYGQSIH